ncbi:sigma factor [Nostocoides veronense]|uniref:sigma factor n=1 Tax=Nostocoides veronense TaxID=330836 RepID=UPI0031DC67E3
MQRDEFSAYVQARWPAPVRTAVLLTGDRHAAEDLVQESLIKAAQHWHRLDGAPTPMSAASCTPAPSMPGVGGATSRIRSR